MKEFRELFKYGTWANVALIDHCAHLTPSVKAASSESTFGSIGETFVHMIEQERWGLWVLGRKVSDSEESSWESLRSTFIHHGALWQEVVDNFEALSDTPLPPAEQWKSPIPEFPLMYALQTAHHQELHRTQIRSILGIMGQLPEEIDSTDVWAYWKERSVAE